MAYALTIDVSSLLKGVEKLKTLPVLLVQELNDELNKQVQEIELNAKGNITAVDMGGLRASINTVINEPLKKHITVNAFYAPFIEFGTGKFAAQRVGTLPADWQAFAAGYRGKKGEGDFYDFFIKMIAWVKRKGIHGVTASGRSKTGKKAEAQATAIAYMMCLSIIKKGIRSQPFLYPAYAQQREKIKTGVATVIKRFI
jgi:hypothetical protein